MAKRLQQTMADYVVIAISPALIMTLVGSLVFFLLEVFYRGQFEGRLHWVLACFIFAAVLIGRITIQEGFERAAPFGIALATAVGLAVTKFVEFRSQWLGMFGNVVNWGLIALIWWCAHRLTWDCTLVDDSQDASGEGLLQTTGIDRTAEGSENGATAPDAAGNASQESWDENTIGGTTSRSNAPTGWWQRHLERQRRPHAPGVWVVYFSLAALPIFGVGQWFIPVENVAGRRYGFWLLCVYVGSGLGLLLTTSFLALRRYLRQRRIEMPTIMANQWLGIGVAIVGALLLFSAMLPRPSAEYEISQLPFTVGSPEQQASRHAPVPREGTQGEKSGTAPDRQPKEDENADASQEPGDSKNSPNGQKGQGGERPSDDSAGQQGDTSQKDGKGAASADKSAGKSQGEQGKNGGQSDKAGQQGKGSKSGESAARDQGKSEKAPQQSPRRTASKSPDKNGQTNNSTAKSEKPQDAERNANPERQSPEPADSPNTQMPEVAQPASQALDSVTTALSSVVEVWKWIFYAIVVLSALYAMWRYREAVVAAVRGFLAELRAFWDALLGRKRAGVAQAAGSAPPEFPPAPFSSFADPFANGIAGRYSLEELVRYSFEAFEAWAREHGCPRQPDQTPHELARDVAKLNAPMAGDARNLAELYARAAYARGSLPPGASEQLELLWQRMRATSGAYSR